MGTRAFLHIGVEKTGTTTIQAFMAKNRQALTKKGVLYPRAPGNENHVGLTIYAADNPQHLFDLLPFANLKPDADLDAFREQMLAELKDGVKRSECETL